MLAPAEPVIPQGLSLADPGLSGIQSIRPDPAQARAEAARLRSERLRQTLVPSCLVLAVTLPLLAGGWFMLDRFSVIRDNALGIAIPISLASVGALFIAATALLMVKRGGPDAN